MTAGRSGGLRRERGMLSTELAILMPIMLLFALVAVFLVQAERHGSRTQQAADAAARAASLTRSEPDARVAAQTAASAVCNGSVVLIESTWHWTEPVPESFTPGSVRVGIACTEQFGGFGPLLSNTSRTESSVAVSVIEYWRSS